MTNNVEIQKEALSAISNISTGKAKLRDTLVKQGVLPALLEMLNCSDPKIIITTLEVVENILKTEELDDNKYAKMVEACGLVETMKLLKAHEDETIYGKATQILKDFYGTCV